MIFIIGAGWYGLHSAKILESIGRKYRIIEKNKDIFMGSSGFNQNRLHLGFHYPRSFETQRRCFWANKFKSSYPDLVFPVKNNVYAVHKSHS